MNKREHAVLSLFYDEGYRELTPSFLAYRMRMRTAEASALLDGMVRNSILDLHIEDEGHITYRLPEAEQLRLDREPRPQPTPEPNRAPFGGGQQRQVHPRNQSRSPHRYPGASAPSAGGTDATPGFAPRGASGDTITATRSTNDGTDGSVRGFRTTHGSWNRSGPVTEQHVSPQGPTVEPYQPQHQHQHPPQAYPTATADYPHADQQPQWNYGGKIPTHQSMVPYQSTYPAHAPRHYPVRIPVLAGALSLLLPGLGQFYNGEIGKGVLLLFSTAFLWIFLLFWIVWIWSVIDAYMVAEYRNQQALNDEDPYPNRMLPDHRNPNHNHNSNVA